VPSVEGRPSRVSLMAGIAFVLVALALPIAMLARRVPPQPPSQATARARTLPFKAVSPTAESAPAERPVTSAADVVSSVPFMDAARAGNASYVTGDLESALAQYRDALERNPRDAESLSNMGQVLVKVNRVAEAVPLFEQACALAPWRWAYRFNLARAVGKLGQWDRAATEYQAAAQLFPDDYVTRFNLAQALHKKGDEAGAIVEYQKAIALSPNDPTFHLALGISYERLQRSAEAAGAYTKYVELAAASPDVERVKARIAALTGAAPAVGAPTNPPAPSGPTR
jgi:Flp pilus assembly protein TadD